MTDFMDGIIKRKKLLVSVHLSFEVGQISKNRYLAGFSFIEVSDHLIIRLKTYFCKDFCVEVEKQTSNVCLPISRFRF